MPGAPWPLGWALKVESVAALTWNSYLTTPLAIGGAATFYGQVGPNVEAVRVIIGSGAAPSAEVDDPSFSVNDLSLSSGAWRGTAWGMSRVGGLTASWFAKVPDDGGIWVEGPVVEMVDLTPDWATGLAWFPDWVTDRLQEMADTNPPFLSKSITIRRSFPRDVVGWPTVSVQLDSLAPSAQVIGDFLGASGAVVGSSKEKGRILAMTVSIVGWSATPEDRSRLGVWLGGAVGLLADMGRYAGLIEPSWSMEESEDFDTLQIPAFLVSARINAQVRVNLSTTVRSGVGRVTV